jgi:AraC-like DNA-binding protein
MLLIEVLRLHLATAPALDSGWVVAVHDPVLNPALAALHAAPAHKWTVAELARSAAVSRSQLDDRFRQVLGRSPIRCLSEWRLHLARELLASTDLGVGVIARRIGYDAEEAFSRAFKARERAVPRDLACAAPVALTAGEYGRQEPWQGAFRGRRMRRTTRRASSPGTRSVVCDRVHPDDDLPPRAVRRPVRHRVRHRRLGRLVEPPPTTHRARDDHPHRARVRPLPCPPAAGAAHMKAATNPWRFNLSRTQQGELRREERFGRLRGRARGRVSRALAVSQSPNSRPVTSYPAEAPPATTMVSCAWGARV